MAATAAAAVQVQVQQQYTTLLVEQRKGVLVVRLNRPKALNSLNGPLVQELTAVVKESASNPSVRCLLLTGEGRGFCAGADLTYRWPYAPAGATRGQVIGHSMDRAYNPMMEALYSYPKPVIVAVNGTAAGGGCGLALAGDVVLAAESASFVQVFAPKLGLVPDLGTTWQLPRLVGRARALGLVLTGERVTAREAADLGMIWKAVPDAELQATALALAERLAEGPTQAFVASRRILDGAWGRSYLEQLAVERRVQEEMGNTPDFEQGVLGFLTKKPPVFTGRPASHL